MKVFAEICVLRPANTVRVIETLVNNGCAVVIRANAYDDYGPTIFVHAYGEIERAVGGARDYFESMLEAIGGDVAEAGKGHQDTGCEVAPPDPGLSFAIDVVENGIAHRISCAEYSPARAFMMAIEAAGLLANPHGKSIGNALARRLLLAALGPIDEEDSEDENAAVAA